MTLTARVAAVQMVSSTRVEDNLNAAAALIEEAAGTGAQLVALPEYFCLMGQRDSDKVALREPDGRGPIQDFLADQARRHGIWLVGGTLPLVAPEPDRVMNSVLVYGPGGERVARYDKIHLFRFTKGDETYDEARTIAPGQRTCRPSSSRRKAARASRSGLSVCYDLRFPELYRAMPRPDLILVPAAFTATTGKAHWEILLRARAVENLALRARAGPGRPARERPGDLRPLDADRPVGHRAGQSP